jgi:hypothetical protein
MNTVELCSCRKCSHCIYVYSQGIKIFQLFDGVLQKLLSEDSGQKKLLDNPDRKSKKMKDKEEIMNEIGCWINLLMKIILNTVGSSDLIGKVLDESERSCYMSQTAAEKVTPCAVIHPHYDKLGS